MRQRITFLQKPYDALDPAKLEITETSLSTRDLIAAREERVTFGVKELPQEVYTVLKGTHELHIRWISEDTYYSQSPLVARLSPGLHIFYTPQRGSNSSEIMCSILKKVFGDLDCVSPEDSFTSLPAERFSHGSAMQYFASLPHGLLDFTAYLSHKLCPSRRNTPTSDCLERLSSFIEVATLDVDFDAISHALTMTAFFPSSIYSPHIKKLPGVESRLEVGIFATENADEIEEVKLSGFVTVLGEKMKASPTLFSFPSRHHSIQGSVFTSRLLEPTGLHPVLQLGIRGSEPPDLEERNCKIHAHLTLPKTIFADRNQFQDPLFLHSKNLTSIHYQTENVDLEAPAYALKMWGSSLLMELKPPSRRLYQGSWTAEIPLHLRYLVPNSRQDGIENTSIPYPAVFWACTAEEGTKFNTNPFDRINLGYEGLFGPRTLFYHLSPEAGVDGKTVMSVRVPVLDLDGSRWVDIGTAAAIGLGFLWVSWCLFGVWKRSGYRNTKEESTGKVKGGPRKSAKREKDL